jgi:riboflavin kinase/FMN adenylyltransferase
VLDRDEVGQAQWVMAWRGAIGPRTRAAAAGEALSGVLGESGASLLFQVVRETHGLSYALGSLWRRDAGLLLVHAGIEEADARRVGLHVRRLVADLATKPVEAARLAAWKAEVHDRFAGLADLPSALSRWWGVAEAWGDAPDPRAASERLLAVTPAAIRAVARRLGPEVVYRLRPAGGDA